MLVVNRKLKQLIRESGKTQGQLAKEIGIPEARLSRIIHGYINPRKSEEEAIAVALGILTVEVFPPQL